jgi:hypothetical protein
MSAPKLTFHVETVRLDAHGSLARCKRAEIPLDTDLAGNPNAFTPAELLLAALSAWHPSSSSSSVARTGSTLRWSSSSP